ncbi:hypothetical protein BS47DRAFT_198818 [Hydnum rufescens UP504]|uniref:Uncharacterized protein n=1 Tax=Hydnum rufescens UP504 TaxID=1448309 RepID=A0A9P6B8A9_9AGAM|nr:hypothetical protein BS47DRAFT_198818 [Hydnum rufescens UP504]
MECCLSGMVSTTWDLTSLRHLTPSLHRSQGPSFDLLMVSGFRWSRVKIVTSDLICYIPPNYAPKYIASSHLTEPRIAFGCKGGCYCAIRPILFMLKLRNRSWPSGRVNRMEHHCTVSGR